MNDEQHSNSTLTPVSRKPADMSFKIGVMDEAGNTIPPEHSAKHELLVEEIGGYGCLSETSKLSLRRC